MSRLGRQQGVSLVELLITMAIMGVVASALGGAVIVWLRNDAPTNARLRDSHDAQLLILHLPLDIVSAGDPDDGDVVWRDDASDPANTACSGVRNLLWMTWGEKEHPGDTPTTYEVAYAVSQDGPTAEWQLVRSECVTPPSGPAGGPETLVVAHRLGPSCDPPACKAERAGRRITVSLTTESGYSFSVSGHRRPE